jgi:hypothetical protein
MLKDPFEGKRDQYSDREKVQICLALLHPRAEQLLRMSWGLDESGYSDAEIAERFAITIERLALMRANARAQFAAIFLRGHHDLPLSHAATLLSIVANSLESHELGNPQELVPQEVSTGSGLLL